jgi:hypothetical protein
LRQLSKNPGFTAVAVLTLAVGLAAVNTIFAVVETVLLRPARLSALGSDVCNFPEQRGSRFGLIGLSAST